MCIQSPLGGLDHVQCTHTASLEEPSHAVVSIHIYMTHLKSISEDISLMLVYELTGLGDIRLMDALAAVQRDDSNWTAIQLYAPPPFSKAAYLLSTWMRSVQAQIHALWNPHSSIYQLSEMLNIQLLQKPALSLRHPMRRKLRKPCWKVMAFSY